MSVLSAIGYAIDGNRNSYYSEQAFAQFGTAILFILWAIIIWNSRFVIVGEIALYIYTGIFILSYAVHNIGHIFDREIPKLLDIIWSGVNNREFIFLWLCLILFLINEKNKTKVSTQTKEEKISDNEKIEEATNSLGKVTKYCSHCGKEVLPEAVVCPNCGCQIKNYNAVQEQDTPSTGFNVLSFFIPIAGLIIYLMDKDKMPRRACAAGKWALMGLGVSFGLVIIYTILSSAVMASLL